MGIRIEDWWGDYQERQERKLKSCQTLRTNSGVNSASILKLMLSSVKMQTEKLNVFEEQSLIFIFISQIKTSRTFTSFLDLIKKKTSNIFKWLIMRITSVWDLSYFWTLKSWLKEALSRDNSLDGDELSKRIFESLKITWMRIISIQTRT